MTPFEWLVVGLLGLITAFLYSIAKFLIRTVDRIDERLYDIARLAAGCDKTVYHDKYARSIQRFAAFPVAGS